MSEQPPESVTACEPCLSGEDGADTQYTLAGLK